MHPDDRTDIGDLASSIADVHFGLARYADAVAAGWPKGDLARFILRDLPRRFHALPHDRQAAVLALAPPLAEPRWDALLAATVEHVARLHGHDVPAWIEEPARFLARPWVVPEVPFMRRNAILYAPAAFIRHGALADPRELDARGGERHAWTP